MRSRISTHLPSDLERVKDKTRKSRSKKNTVRVGDNIVERAVDILLNGAAHDDDRDESDDAYTGPGRYAWGAPASRKEPGSY